MKRRSLSASFGSWCVQLIYNPRRAASERFLEPGASQTSSCKEQKTSDLALLLPAFLASWTTVAAGSYALSHFITAGSFTSSLALILVGAAFIALGAQCFALPWRRLCEASRWPLVLVLILLAISTRFNNVIPLDETSESNGLVAVFLCFITLLSVLLAGAQSGGRIVPLSAPLVPGLSLFGLMCLISVDAQVQVCFLIFLAASIYLLCYNRFLRRVRPDLVAGICIDPTKPLLLPLHRQVLMWSRQSLLITSVWLLVFLGGGAMLYVPVQQLLPALVTPQLNRMRAAAQNSMLDFRGSASVMELHGGTYVLSDRPVVRVTMQQGEPSGLWRGRVYERYERSQWDEGADDHTISWPWHPHYRYRRPGFSSWQLRESPPHLKSGEGSIRYIKEEVEPIEELPSPIASGAGRVISPAFNAGSYQDYTAPEVTPFDNGDNSPSGNNAVFTGRNPYRVNSFVVEPNWGALLSASGYEKSPAIPTSLLGGTLQLPDDSDLTVTLRSLVRKMYGETRRPPRTPFAKVRTVSNYLLQNCTYSLQSPTVPKTRDAVEFFLNDSRQGACDMFASSMVLLLRQMNVPARMVTGYLQPDDTSPKSGLEQPSYLLRERDAHAWVEYYVPKYGWLSYDPTAGTRTADEAFPAQFAQWLNVPIPNISSHLLLLGALGLGLIALGAAWSRPKVQFVVPAEAQDEQLRRFVEARYARALSRLRRQVPHPAHLTPGEYEARVCRAVLPTDAKQEFAALTHLTIAARYGHLDPVLPEDIDACLHRFETALKQGKRGVKREFKH